MKISRKLIRYIIMILLTIIIVGGIYLKNIGLIYIIEKVSSPDKATNLVVYNYNKFLKNKEESIKIKTQHDDGTNNPPYAFTGKYDGIYWTNDSSKYVLKVKDYLSNIYVVDRNSGNIIGMDLSLDSAFQDYINNYSDSFNFKIDNDFKGNYEFIKWENNSDSMLVSYEFKDLENNIHNGYFIYDYSNSKIQDMLPSII